LLENDGTVRVLDNAAIRRSLPPVIFALFVGALAKLLAGGTTTVTLPPREHALPANATGVALTAGRYRTPASITPTVHFAIPDSGWIATTRAHSWRLDRRMGGVIAIVSVALSVDQAETHLGRIRELEYGEFVNTTFGTHVARQAEGLANSAVSLTELGGFRLESGDRFRVVFAEVGQTTLAVLAAGRGLGFLDFLKEAKRIFRTFRIV
jgi:hypothetical protein